MLDRRFIRDNPDAVKHAVRVKGVDLDVDELLALDKQVRSLQHQLDELRHERRAVAAKFRDADPDEREALRARAPELDSRMRVAKEQLDAASSQLHELMLTTPQVPWDQAPIGDDESANVVVKTWGDKPTFDFDPLDHVDLAEKRGWVEFERARNISGARGYALTGDLVLLERALHSLALDMLVDQDFRIISVPVLTREEALTSTGFFPLHRAEVYAIPEDDLYLAGTSEVGLVGLHADERLSADDLPLRYAGISTCFRREAGSAGRDVRGFLRVHQFEKVEQFVICQADRDESARWHGKLLGTAEAILQSLGLAYEVVECCTGDMGLGKFRMNDINTWFPSLGKFRETHSCSTLHDWQARRANIRYKDANGETNFAHTLNNTALATPRLIAALVENCQTADHRVRVPEALRPYLGNRDHL